LDRLAGEIEPKLVAVLSDINMPGMDGLELLGEIKQRFPELPVMMVTAYGDDERRRQATKCGAAEFLTKPVDFEYLKAQLRQLPSAHIEERAARSNDRSPPAPIDPGAPGEGRLRGRKTSSGGQC
jgi:DNA-binding NtrC family response regulator